MLLGSHQGPLPSGQSCDGKFATGQGHESFVQLNDLRCAVQTLHNLLQTKTAAQRMDALLRNENSFIAGTPSTHCLVPSHATHVREASFQNARCHGQLMACG
jgi:hypothetical protein